jgi:hypothetical protein
MRSLISRAALLVALPVASGVAQQQVDIGRRTAPDVALRLVGPFSRLTVIGWDRDSVSITGTLPKGARFDGGFAETRGVPARNGKWFMDAPETGGAGGAIVLRVPARARLYVKVNSAEVDASGLTGEFDLSLVGGSARIAASPRTLNVDAMDASVTIDGSPEWVRLKTSEGDITMRGSSPDAAFTTISGAVHVGNGTYERANVVTVSGAVTFSGDLARDASLRIDTHSGAVDMLFGANASAGIDAVTLTATIENLLTKQRAVAGRERGQELGLELGTGDGRVVIRTFKGGIRLAGRKP